jgi:transcriptional regulator with XRE-family HTH domain
MKKNINKTVILKTIGDVVRYCRNYLGETQTEFGVRFEALPTTVSKWERNLTIPGGDRYYRVMELFNQIQDGEYDDY